MDYRKGERVKSKCVSETACRDGKRESNKKGKNGRHAKHAMNRMHFKNVDENTWLCLLLHPMLFLTNRTELDAEGRRIRGV